ncbi:MAG: galactose ABC transporter substrate-binding protein [Lachnospiraceae bacterium]
MSYFKISIMTCMIVLMVFLFGCDRHDIETQKTLRVGVVLYTQDDPFINALTDCLKEEFVKKESESMRIIMTVRDGKDDQSVQNEVVEEIIDAGCDILCVDLVDRTEPSKIIEMAKKENIPVIFFNREPVSEDLMQWDKLYYVGGDAAQSGIMQGEIAADVIHSDNGIDRNQDGKIQYVLLEGEAGHQDAIIRTDSVVKTLMNSGIELEKISYQFADWNRGQAENKMMHIIEQYGDSIELILANNDEMAAGAVDAYDQYAYVPFRRPVIFGIDGLDHVLNMVSQGTIQGTVYNDKEGQALQIANMAIDLFQNNALDHYDFVNGRYIFLPYQKVDRNNVEEYIEHQ